VHARASGPEPASPSFSFGCCSPHTAGRFRAGAAQRASRRAGAPTASSRRPASSLRSLSRASWAIRLPLGGWPLGRGMDLSGRTYLASSALRRPAICGSHAPSQRHEIREGVAFWRLTGTSGPHATLQRFDGEELPVVWGGFLNASMLFGPLVSYKAHSMTIMAAQTQPTMIKTGILLGFMGVSSTPQFHGELAVPPSTPERRSVRPR
jgi:hypothetical protein